MKPMVSFTGTIDKSEYWIKIKKDARHYHYKCGNCGEISKYRRTPYCPICGTKKVDDSVLTESGKIELRYSRYDV